MHIHIRALFLPLLLVWPALSWAAEAPTFDEGIDYELIVPAQPGGSGGTVEVSEMFWYGCPHCYSFEPKVQKWLASKPDYVEFRRVPAIFSNPRWRLHARAFYAADVLDVTDAMHPVIFHAIHEQQKRLDSVEKLVDIFGEHGVSEEDFREAFDSFAVQSGVSRSADLTKRYGIDGVPTMVVNGKYRIDGPMAGSYDKLIETVNFLAEKEHKASIGQ